MKPIKHILEENMKPWTYYDIGAMVRLILEKEPSYDISFILRTMAMLFKKEFFAEKFSTSAQYRLHVINDLEINVESIGDEEMFKCLRCGYDSIMSNHHFCPFCGLKIIWDLEVSACPELLNSGKAYLDALTAFETTLDGYSF